ncbi:hypothetical protein FB567DRAFT_90998 [Paraphoma chrysanthemicola]|uniref:Uncharacterized protein n=1 Tax=Paraphoma chrysanthemicola TaxID=798071 RepID=A0A8K0R1S7_9PLEO|nr:hypothetical protein FB567DRAFT_90998 [Paraphoma chrysanthemicola]
MIFCSIGRYKQLYAPEHQNWYDTSMKNRPEPPFRFKAGTIRTSCYNTEYDVNNLEGRTMAFTTHSDTLDLSAYRAAAEPKKLNDFSVRRPDIAFAIDVCTWFLHKQLLLGWPSITHDRIAQTQQPGFRGGITDLSTPIDGLRNAALTLLHELTHTQTGGLLDDLNGSKLPPGVPDCYGWKCVQLLKDPSNSDNVAMLGLALHIWSMGYYVDQDGNIIGRP